ncbi:hypothetical protein ColTof3_08083 [Colletotrichum tofieldiae]|nr:hypothetical protein ColTof3_08083 [Colletotrichum tofieldiae]
MTSAVVRDRFRFSGTVISFVATNGAVHRRRTPEKLWAPYGQIWLAAQRGYVRGMAYALWLGPGRIGCGGWGR